MSFSPENLTSWHMTCPWICLELLEGEGLWAAVYVCSAPGVLGSDQRGVVLWEGRSWLVCWARAFLNEVQMCSFAPCRGRFSSCFTRDVNIDLLYSVHLLPFVPLPVLDAAGSVGHQWFGQGLIGWGRNDKNRIIFLFPRTLPPNHLQN